MASSRALEVLTALQLRGVGPVRVRKLLDGAKEEQQLLAPGSALWEQFGDEERSEAQRRADQIDADCSAHGVEVICFRDASFPAALRTIPEAPALVYVVGRLAALEERAVAVVGTRKASQKGLEIAEHVGRSLTERGWATVSGLALGIDAAAHVGCVKAGGTGVAVLGGGLDQITPKTNTALARALLEGGGALLSEEPPGVVARGPQLVRRNRLQSGLARASLVIECSPKGGAASHAKFATKQGRPLYTVIPSGSPADLDTSGAQHLARTMNAVPVASMEELLARLDGSAGGAAGATQSTQGSLPF